MELCELRLTNLRNIAGAEITLGPGLSEFVGANGAGRRRFSKRYTCCRTAAPRAVKRESLIRFGEQSLEVFAVIAADGFQRRLGLSRRRGDWAARLDGAEVGSLAELLREVAVVCFEPGSHALISGAAEERRHFVDWALFPWNRLMWRWRGAIAARSANATRCSGRAVATRISTSGT